MVDIKKCPFCGGHPIIEREASGYATALDGKQGYRCQDVFFVRCINCGAVSKKVKCDYDMADDLTNEELECALNSWNERDRG